MEWKKISLEDKEWMTRKFMEENRQGCENTFGTNFIWRDIYHVEVACKADCLLLRFRDEKNRMYSFPVGNGDKKLATEFLIEDAKAENSKVSIRNVVDKDKVFLEKNFPDIFAIQPCRDVFDYIYTVEKLTKLSGKKLHGKRNHIARFKDNNDWHYEPMGKDNIPACLQMHNKWCEMQKDKWNVGMENESYVVREAIRYFEELGFDGGVLYSGEQIVAFTIGEPLNKDTYVVHIEKAFPDIQGAYPMINQQFVMHECQDFLYVNREDDTGAEGLRKAKLSYEPDILLEKYIADIK